MSDKEHVDELSHWAQQTGQDLAAQISEKCREAGLEPKDGLAMMALMSAAILVAFTPDGKNDPGNLAHLAALQSAYTHRIRLHTMGQLVGPTEPIVH